MKIGDKVYSVGNPKGLDGTFASGEISAIRNNAFPSKTSPLGVRVFQFTAPASPGSSGGPLINDRGHVIGVVKSQYRAEKIGDAAQLLNFAAPVDYVKNLLKEVQADK